MPSVDQIKQQLSQLREMKGFKIWVEDSTIKLLSNILRDNERIEDIISGVCKEGHGAAVATNERLLFVSKKIKLFDKGFSEDLTYQVISSVQAKQAGLNSSIEVYAPGYTAVITKTSASEALRFSEYIKTRMTVPVVPHFPQSQQNFIPPQIHYPQEQKFMPKASASDAPTPTNPIFVRDIVSQLERLAKLREQGFLTEKEFEKQKKKLLGA